MNSNNCFSIILMSILCNSNMVNGYEGGRKENQKKGGESQYTIKRVRDEKSNYTFRLCKARQIIEGVHMSPSNIALYEKPIKICTMCIMDDENADRMCRTAIVTLRLGEKYNIRYINGMPVEQARLYRLQRRHSKVPKDKLVFARKCPTIPSALYLTSGRSPRLVTVVMKSPGRLRRLIHPNTDIGLL